jgi:hypothetical protein
VFCAFAFANLPNGALMSSIKHIFLTVVFLPQLSDFFVLLPAKEVEGEGAVNVNTLAMPSLK